MLQYCGRPILNLPIKTSHCDPLRKLWHFWAGTEPFARVPFPVLVARMWSTEGTCCPWSTWASWQQSQTLSGAKQGTSSLWRIRFNHWTSQERICPTHVPYLSHRQVSISKLTRVSAFVISCIEWVVDFPIRASSGKYNYETVGMLRHK